MVLFNNSHLSLDILSLNSEIDVYLILFNSCIMSFTFPFLSPFPFIKKKKTLLSYILGIIKYIYLKCAVHWILKNVCSLSASSQDIEYFYYLQNFPHRYSLKNMYVQKKQALRPGALGRPRGIGWRGRWEGGSGWGTHVKKQKKKKNMYVLLWNDCQIFCPFEKWSAVFLLSCKCSLYLFWTRVFCQVCVWWILFPSSMRLDLSFSWHCFLKNQSF